MKEAACIKVPKSLGEKAVTVANKLRIIDKGLEIQSDCAFIYVPILRALSEGDLKTLKEQLRELEVLIYAFPERRKKAVTFAELLESKLPPHLLASLPRSMDLIGDVAVLEIPPELNAYKNVIGDAILQANKNVRTVLAKAGAVSGTYRVREFDVIAGERKTETIHKEHGCRYRVDLAKAYFSPRLSYERKRVASLVKEGETVVDMFAGVGPFSILIAKTCVNVTVYAVDLNPCAIELLDENVNLNKVRGKVQPILGDARQVVKERLVNIADRVIMNLPEKAIEFVDVACETLKVTGGVVHFYCFVRATDSLEDVKFRFTDAVKECGRIVGGIPFSRFVRATAPYEWQAVLDAEIL